MFLIECGLDPKAMDDFGTTPFSEARRKKNKVFLFLQKFILSLVTGVGND